MVIMIRFWMLKLLVISQLLIQDEQTQRMKPGSLDRPGQDSSGGNIPSGILAYIPGKGLASADKEVLQHLNLSESNWCRPKQNIPMGGKGAHFLFPYSEVIPKDCIRHFSGAEVGTRTA